MKRRPLGLTLLASALLGVPLASCSAQAPSNSPDRTEAPKVTTRGLDPTHLARTIEQARQLPRLRSLVILRHGETLVEQRFNDGPALDRPVNIKSASKTILSAVTGIAIDRGVLTGTEQPILPILRQDAPSDPDPRLAQVTVGHLLSMRAGLERTSGEYYGPWVSSPNWVRYALSRPFVEEPGGRMLYSTGSSYLLSAALTKASGRTMQQLAQDWLGTPLGIRIAPWPRDPQGIYFGGNDMLMSPRDLASFGELYRNGGKVGQRQVVPARWIRESWEPRTTSPWSGNAYGYGWFLGDVRGHPVRFAWGYGGQMLYVLPGLALTVVMTSQSDAARDSGHVDALHRLLAEGIVPAAEAGSRRAS